MTDSNATGIILITKTPLGEAPLPVREAWIGCELPCYPIAGYYNTNGARTRQPQNSRYGFCVPQEDAFAILAQNKADFAVQWWKGYGYPRANEYLIFGLDEAQIISGVSVQPLQYILVDDDMRGDPFR